MRYILLLVLNFLLGCTAQNIRNGQLILISKDSGDDIAEWITELDTGVVTQACYGFPEDSLEVWLEIASGIIIGGGEDVDPALYGKPEYLEHCGDIDPYRDSLEFKMVRYAMDHKIPILGICRGHQMLNVAMGGTLIPDILTFTRANDHRVWKDRVHLIIIGQDSWLDPYFVEDTLWVNSKHHQCIDRLADDFVVAAWSTDSIIESIELRETVDHPCVLGVQWHPEDLRDSLSRVCGRYFLEQFRE